MLHAHPRAAVAIPLPRHLPKDLRPAIEAAIERHQDAMEGLLALLDAFDGDPDLDLAIEDLPHDEEPDREITCEDEGADADVIAE